MKNNLRKLAALVLALCMTLGMFAGAFDSYEVSDTGSINVTVSAAKQTSGYSVTYTAVMTMPEPFAKYAAVNAGVDGTLKTLRFTCVLEDDLVKQLTSPKLSDFTFTGGSASNFEFIGISNNGAGLEIEYKLKESVIASWKTMGAEAIKTSLMKPMTMKATKTVTTTQMTNSLDSSNKLNTNARVDISMNDGSDVPFYGQAVVTGAIGAGSVTVSVGGGGGSGGGGSGGGGGSSTPTKYSITVVNPESKGSVTSSHLMAESGTKIVITSAADEGYRLTKLDVVSAKGDTISVSKTGDNTYTFTMPSANVTVTPTFDGAIASPDDTGVSGTLNTDDHIAYMFGDNHGNFRPKANITRAEVCQVFYNLMKDKSVQNPATFSDVDQNQWYAAAVNKLASMGIVNGVGGGRFEPNRAITRAEFATVVARFAKENPNGFSFTDVPETHWAHAYITTAVAYGWIGGVGNNRFEPERNILRTEAATLVNHMLGRIPDKAAIDAGKARVWPDVDKGYWGYYEIAEATTQHNYTFNDDRTVETWKD